MEVDPDLLPSMVYCFSLFIAFAMGFSKGGQR
jgi:hypothetical protein